MLSYLPHVSLQDREGLGRPPLLPPRRGRASPKEKVREADSTGLLSLKPLLLNEGYMALIVENTSPVLSSPVRHCREKRTDQTDSNHFSGRRPHGRGC
jgi:hypothetical protein